MPYFTHLPKVPTCSLTEDVASVTPIKGTIKENTCNCGKPSEPSIGDAKNALIEDKSKVYINKWAINGGIEVKPKYEGGLHSFKICNSEDCPNCDPTCYKIEGYCESSNKYVPIKEGPLLLPKERNQCVTVRIAGKPLYRSYRIIFPCQRGTCRDSCGGDCHAKPVQNPKTGPCPSYQSTGANIGSMSFISKEYDKINDKTTFIYSVSNINLMYLRLAWEGDCRVDNYYVFKDEDGNLKLDDPSACCFRKCGNDMVKDETVLDPFLCMQGVMFISGAWKPGMYVIKMQMHGFVGETTSLPYGMVGRDNGNFVKEYGSVISPKCPEVLCEATCPLKLSQFSLFTQDCVF